MKTELNCKEKRNHEQVRLTSGLLLFTLLVLWAAGVFMVNALEPDTLHDGLAGSGRYSEPYETVTVSAQDRELLDALEALDFSSMTLEEFKKHFHTQREKSDTFYGAASDLGHNAVYVSKDQNEFHTALFFTAIEVYADELNDQNIFPASYFTSFGDFDDGEDGAVSVSIGYMVDILVPDPARITVAKRDRTILSLLEKLNTTLDIYQKEDWTSMNLNEQLKTIFDITADKCSSEEIRFTIHSINADIFQL